MTSDPMLELMFDVDRFLRYDLAATISRGGSLEPQRDWRVVHDAWHRMQQLAAAQDATTQAEIAAAFDELEGGLNQIASQLRQGAMLKGVAAIDEAHYLTKLNATIDGVRARFSERLAAVQGQIVSKQAEKNQQPAPLPSTPESRSDTLLKKLKNHRLGAIVFVVGAVVIGVGAVSDGLSKTWQFASTFLRSPAASVPASGARTSLQPSSALSPASQPTAAASAARP